MNENKFQQLKDIIDHLPKSKILAGESVPNGRYKFYLSGQKEGRINIATANQNAIIMGDGGVANVAFAEGKYSYSSHNFGFFSKIKHIETSYIFRAIEHFLPVIDYKGFVGSGIKNIDKTFLFNLYIQILPLAEQKKIASILTSVDEVIEITQKEIDKLQDLKNAILNELLTRGIGHTDFKDSELGRIPKSWEVVKLETISDFITKGATPTTYGFDWQKSGILFVKSESVKKGEFLTAGSMRVSKEAHNAMERSKVCGGDILVSITGYIGNACIFPTQYGEANINQHIARVRIQNKNLSKFVMYFLNAEAQYQRYLSIQTGQAYPQLSLQQIRETHIPILPPDEIKKIVGSLSSIDDSIDQKKQKLFQTQSLKKSLMQDLLTGKVRVKVN